ncbi:MAG: cytochrome c family protein [Beijerinckiaceae bacterium]|nr:cytochrome c family protein [Beijerinckiaceae bacterium]
MDANEVNKVAGAILGMLTLAMGIGFLSSGLMAPKLPAKAGYELPDNTANASSAAAPAAEKAEPIAARLAKADLAKGETAAKKCVSCHQFQKDGKNGQGPALWGIVNKAKGAAAGFNYSAGLKDMASKGGKWDYEALDAFLANPKAYVAGTSMGFAGINRPDERANIIFYMRSLAETPAALP